jgi:hypothetical protein
MTLWRYVRLGEKEKGGHDMARASRSDAQFLGAKPVHSVSYRWGIVALLAAGWFLHDASLHASLVTLGFNWLLGLEFSLPDLSQQGIYPDRLIQALAMLFALLAAGGFIALGTHLLRTSLCQNHKP